MRLAFGPAPASNRQASNPAVDAIVDPAGKWWNALRATEFACTAAGPRSHWKSAWSTFRRPRSSGLVTVAYRRFATPPLSTSIFTVWPATRYDGNMLTGFSAVP